MSLRFGVRQFGFGNPARSKGGGGWSPAYTLPSQQMGVNADGTAGIASFAVWLGKAVDAQAPARVFADNGMTGISKASSLSKLGTQLAMFSGASRPRELALPLVFTDATMSQVANGAADSTFDAMADALIADRPDDLYYAIGPGWEAGHYGSYPWYAVGNEAAYQAAFVRCIDRFRAKTRKTVAAWCNQWAGRDINGDLVDPMTFYPGDSHVDAFSMNFYSLSAFDAGKLGTTIATEKIGDLTSFGLAWNHATAIAHGKREAYSEWGSNAENPLFALHIIDWLISVGSNMIYADYWDNTGPTGFNCQLSGDQFPVMGAEFKRSANPPAIPALDGYTANLTGANSIGRKLKTGTGDPYTYSIVSGVNRIEAVKDQSGNGRDLPAPGAGQRPVLGVSGGKVAGVLDGTQNLDSGSNASSAFITAGDGYIITEFEATSIGADEANKYDNDCVFGDSAGYLALPLRNAPAVNGYNYDGTVDLAPADTSAAISLNARTFVEWRHTGGNLSVRVNKGTWKTVASGNTGSLSAIMRWGRGSASTSFMTGKIVSLITYNAYPGDAAADAIMDRLLAA